MYNYPIHLFKHACHSQYPMHNNVPFIHNYWIGKTTLAGFSVLVRAIVLGKLSNYSLHSRRQKKILIMVFMFKTIKHKSCFHAAFHLSAFSMASAAAFAASLEPIFCSAFAKASTSVAVILYGVLIGPGKDRVSTSCLYSDSALLMASPILPNWLQNFGVTCKQSRSTHCAQQKSQQSKTAYKELKRRVSFCLGMMWML